MKGRLVLWLAAGAAIGAGAFFLADPRNFVVVNPRGLATSGSVFGVEVGMPMSEGEAHLMRLSGVTKLASPPKQDGICYVGHDQQLSMFDDHSWRQGGLCLIAKGGRVEKIVWDYDSVIPTFP